MQGVSGGAACLLIRIEWEFHGTRSLGSRWEGEDVQQVVEVE